MEEGIFCLKQWVLSANEIISIIDDEHFNIDSNQLHLILYFKDNNS